MKLFIQLWLGFAAGMAVVFWLIDRADFGVADLIWPVLAGAVFAFGLTLYLRDRSHPADSASRTAPPNKRL